MADVIKTIITYSITCEEMRKEFTNYLENHCQASSEIDQSTYTSPLDKEEILLRLQIKHFKFGEKDHVTLYYSVDKANTCQTILISRLSYFD